MAEASAGATPAVEGATPSQTPAMPAPATTPAASTPATDDEEQLEDGGKRALQQERAARKALESRLKAAEAEAEKLRTATLSESERAIAEAKAAGVSEATAKADARVRRAETRMALTAAGVNPKLLDIVAKADEFSGLTVTDDGDVEGLKDAVSAFKKSNPDLFGAIATPSADLGAAGPAGRGLTLDQIRAFTPKDHAERRNEVMEFLSKNQSIPPR